jgi:hypothetical protein
MKYCSRIVVALLVAIPALAFAYSQAAAQAVDVQGLTRNQIVLTPEEQTWLKAHPEITLGGVIGLPEDMDGNLYFAVRNSSVVSSRSDRRTRQSLTER